MIPGIKGLIFGRAGSGKTWSTRTIFNKKEVTPFWLFTEPSMSTIGSFPEAHWAYLNPYGESVTKQTLLDMATKINTLGNDDLQKAGVGNKRDFKQWFEFINLLNDFKCENPKHTDCHWGDVQTWSTDRVLIIDGLTGMTAMARGLQSGMKPLLTQPDYGVIMNNLGVMIQYLTHQLTCHMFLISHIEIERDEINGGTIKSLSTIGRKLAPTIPPMFDDVVIARKESGQFFWSTTTNDADVKNRNLPLSDNISQNFVPWFEAWEANGGEYGETVVAGGNAA